MPRGSPGVGFNGGKSQVNLGYLQASGDYPFRNLLKMSQFWSWSDNNTTDPMLPTYFDNDGYPTTIVHGGVISGQLSIPTSTNRPGNYVIKWDGSGTVVQQNAPITTYNVTAITHAGSCILTIPGNNYHVGDQIPISGIGGTVGLNNNKYTVTGVAGSAVTISASTGSDCSANYTSCVSGTCATFSTSNPAGTSNRIVVSPVGVTQIGVAITAINSSIDYPHNLAVVYDADEAGYDAGQIFGDKFITRLQEANFGVVRFFKWDNDDLGINNCSTWNNCNRPTTYYQYQSGQIRTDLLVNQAGGGLTSTTTGSDYTASAPSTWPALVSGHPADKATVHVVFGVTAQQCDVSNFGCTLSAGASNNVHWVGHNKKVGNGMIFTDGTSGGGNTQPIVSTQAFPYANVYYVKSITDADNFLITTTPPPNSATGTTATVTSIGGGMNARPVPTLSVGGSTAAPIIGNQAGTLNSYELPTAGSLGSLGTLVYDVQLAAWMLEGGSVNGPNATPGYLQNGVPKSLYLTLCNQVGAHPWVQIPRYAQVSGTDYTTQIATMFKNSGPSWMVPRFEASNEDWGGAISGYGMNLVNSLWGIGLNVDQWHGYAISVIGQTVNAVYGGTPSTQTKYQIIDGMQLGQFRTFSESNSGNNQARVTASAYVTNAKGGNTAFAAYNWITHIAPSIYFTPTTYGRNQEVSDAYTYYYTNGAGKYVNGVPPSGAALATASAHENSDIDGIQISSMSVATPTLITTAVNHNLVVGQVVQIITQNGDHALIGPSGATNAWVITTPAANTLTISSTDFNNPAGVPNGGGGTTPIGATGSGSGTSWLIPNANNNIREVIVNHQNAAFWLQGTISGNNTNLKVTSYEGGYSPDYSMVGTFAYITGMTNASSAVITAPVVSVQDIRATTQQSVNSAAQPFIGGTAPAGMNLNFSGCGTLGNGWAVADGTVVHINSVSGNQLTTNLNKSGATGTFASALTTAGKTYCTATLQDANGIDSVTWMNNLRWAGKYSTNLQANLLTLYNGLPGTAPFPSMFQETGPYTPCSTNQPPCFVWAVLEDIYLSPNPPQWLGAIQFNH